MYLVRTLPLVAALSVVVVSSLSHSEEQQPQTAPNARRRYHVSDHAARSAGDC